MTLAKFKKEARKRIIEDFQRLDMDNRVSLFTALRSQHPWEYRVAAMGPAEQNFYKATVKRSENA
jgi:hypothetical protein